jgi:preprotein translocase subunit SecF
MNIVGKRKLYFLIAAVLAVICIASIVAFGIKPGVEFSSGSILNITFDKPVSETALTQELNNLGYNNILIQSDGQAVSPGQFLGYNIRLNSSSMNDAQKTQLTNTLTSNLGTFKTNEFDNISPMIATETTRNASIAVIVAVVAMLVYIAFAFRKMPNPFKYGVCAVGGLAFDLLIAIGVFSICGKIIGWQIDLMFIAGILAVLGFSINNTIIVFDRIRENMGRGLSPDIEVVANASIVQTLGRSFNTALTVIVTLVVLLIFIGSTIQNFVMVLLIGTISGVFTSTFLSPELLVAWQKRASGNASRNNLAAAKARS